MSTSDRLLPQGGISVSDSVYVFGVYNNTLYVLSSIANDVVMVPVYTSPSTGSTLNPDVSNRITFSIGFRGDSITFVTSTNRYLSQASGTLTLSSTNTTPTEPIYLSQNVYTSFASPELVLSSVLYNIFGGSSFEPLQVRLQDSTVVEMPILLVPTSYFTGCRSGNNAPVTDFQRIVNTTYCSHFNQSWCSSGVDREAWTSQSECLEGRSYTYCANGTTCSGTCKSGCWNGTGNEECIFNGSSYNCQERTPDVMVVNTSTPTTPSTTTSDSWWIILVVLAVIFIIATVVYALYARKRPVHRQEHYHHQTEIINRSLREPSSESSKVITG